jgi:hypothetical protein
MPTASNPCPSSSSAPSTTASLKEESVLKEPGSKVLISVHPFPNARK